MIRSEIPLKSVKPVVYFSKIQVALKTVDLVLTGIDLTIITGYILPLVQFTIAYQGYSSWAMFHCQWSLIMKVVRIRGLGPSLGRSFKDTWADHLRYLSSIDPSPCSSFLSTQKCIYVS